MSHVWRRHVTYMNESRHTCEWGMSHVWTSHVTHVSESCYTYERVMSHMWMRHVTLTNESLHICPTCGKTLSQIWLRHVTHMDATCHICHTNEWVMSHTWATERMHRPWRCVTSHMWMRHVTHMNEACHTYESAMWRVWMSQITHMNNRADAPTMTLCHVTHVNEACHAYEWGMSHIWISHVTRMNVSYHTHKQQRGRVNSGAAWRSALLPWFSQDGMCSVLQRVAAGCIVLQCIDSRAAARHMVTTNPREIFTQKTDNTQINLKKRSLVHPKSNSNQSSKPCTGTVPIQFWKKVQHGDLLSSHDWVTMGNQLSMGWLWLVGSIKL